MSPLSATVRILRSAQGRCDGLATRRWPRWHPGRDAARSSACVEGLDDFVGHGRGPTSTAPTTHAALICARSPARSASPVRACTLRPEQCAGPARATPDPMMFPQLPARRTTRGRMPGSRTSGAPRLRPGYTVVESHAQGPGARQRPAQGAACTSWAANPARCCRWC